MEHVSVISRNFFSDFSHNYNITIQHEMLFIIKGDLFYGSLGT